MNRALVILPTLNESEVIRDVVSSILDQSFALPIRILVVDDDSPDGTAELVRQTFRNDPRVEVLQRRGKPRGLVPSLNDAIASADEDFLIWLDADQQMPAEVLPLILEKNLRAGVSAVVGTRFLPGGGDLRDRGKSDSILIVHRHLSRCLNLLVPAFLWIPGTDFTSGLISIRRRDLPGRLLQGQHGEYFIELMHELYARRLRVVEHPYELQDRPRGVSKSTGNSWSTLVRTGLRYLFVIGRLYFGKRLR